MKSKVLQVNMRIPDFMKEEIEEKRVEFINKHQLDCSFNAYVQRLLRIALEVEAEDNQ